MDRMLCGYRDDSRLWDEPEQEEETDPRTEMEKRLSWIESEWSDALRENSYDTWRDIRMMVYGASQALVWSDRYEEAECLRLLGNIAFDNSIQLIGRAK